MKKNLKNDLVLLLTTGEMFGKEREKLFIGSYRPLGGQIVLNETYLVDSVKISLLKKDSSYSIRLDLGEQSIDLALEEKTIQLLDDAYIIITKDDIEKAMIKIGMVTQKTIADLDLI